MQFRLDVSETWCVILVNRSCYIRWEMTPTSIGGEKQASISGGSQSPI